MAQNNVVNFKVFLRDSETTDARRFSVDAPVVTNFMFLNEKLLSIFPVLRDADFKITWKDSDGDEITIANDEDLITALTEMVGNIKNIFVTILNKNEDIREEPVTLEADINVGRRIIICDVCERTIEGFRYNCLQCPDFDLCKDCEHKGHHSEHLMVRMVNSDFFPRLNRRFVHDITRCIKRNIKSARKDCHRFNKHGPKLSETSQGKKCGEKLGESSENKNSENSSNDQQQQQPFGGRCPFSGGQNNNNYEGGFPFSSGDRVNMDDFHNLGALARQHLDPILSMLSPPTSASGNSQGGAADKPLLFDVIQNAVDGFFGRYAAPQNPTQQQEPQQQQQQKDTSQTPDQNSNQQSASQEPASATPMEQDQPTVPPQQQPQQQPQQPSPQNQEKPAEPGWAFVAQNTHNPPPTSPTENTTSQPTAPTPTIIYHSNPVIAEGLTRLHEMGFSNESGFLTQLLERYRGDVSQVVKALVDLKI